MWFDREMRSALFKAFLSASWFSALLYSNGAYAVGVPNLSVMLTNFASSVPNLMQLVTAGAFVIGMFLVVAAVMGMKHFGELRTMMTQEHSISGPLVEFFVGISLLYLPSTIRSGLSTFWISTNPYAYVSSATDQYTTFINACYSIMQLVGVIAFIRGLLMLKAAGGGKAQQGMLGKAAAHLVGGIMCMNIYNTLQVLQATVGWTP